MTLPRRSSWRPVAVDLETIERAWDLQDRFGFSWGDALIAAAALGAGCRFLLSDDFQDGQIVDGLTIMSPLTRRPEEVLGER